MSKIGLVYGEDRKNNIKTSLSYIKDDIITALKGKDTILIKPNLVAPSRPLACTHKDAILGLLEFLKENNLIENKKIIIAEGSAYNTEDGFKNMNYYDILKIFPNIQFLDLNKTDYIKIKIYDRNLNLFEIKCAKIMEKKFNPNIFYISICPAKTHDTVLVTLSIKNIIVGSLLDDKPLIHQSYKAINLTLAKIYKEHISPDLSIIDAYEAMEGNGPVDGIPIKMNISISSIDPIYADALMSYLMGVEPFKVGYLYHLGIREDFLNKIEVLGEVNFIKYKRNLKLHKDYLSQLNWS